MHIIGNAEANGLIVQSIVAGSGIFENRARMILREKGIVEMDEHGWFPLLAVLETLAELKRTIGKEIICEIGKSVALRTNHIEGVETFEQALRSLNEIYLLNHRGVTDKVVYECVQLTTKQFQIRCFNLYPVHFNLGILRGMARKYSDLVRIESLPSELAGGEFKVLL
ncbi:hypothetical protein CIG75_14505 [Tumebacillus algifaecis]|uniref:Uncharacterized protein n=1 Tax=Tumebacillus algifaecis TaxID=1214604 RepID=A0A223D3G8_9BACL|nr:hypothetical protein [Tumebacillus algifaecis]ASS76045.1 hypothetical protein CIG75_14505 [Tumebacillus algifaecis]